jgi:hypothetical protein
VASPTQRTLAECKRLGWQASIVEKFVRFPPPGHRVDLFGFIDILALGDGQTYAIQATVTSSAGARRTKIDESPALAAVLASGWIVEVWSFRKTNDRQPGKRKTWKIKRERLVGPSLWETVGEKEEIPS